ncbi:autoinducer binding domain-containing protein [Oceanicaulis sp. LC35]|uniref:helix-turn-helix transcriptional regulator n=1 Tax=Oceanicaulis sp. LC35 TaxID=3349635 RepID=UPI003F87740B
MAETLLRFLEHSAAADSVDALCAAFKSFVEGYGVEAFGYQVLPSPFDASDTSFDFEYNTFPANMHAAYLDERLFEHDPVTSRAATALQPQYWFEVEQTSPGTRFSQRLFALLREAGFADGFTIPVFGPYGLAAFVACGRFSGPFSLTAIELRVLQLASQELFSRTVGIRDVDAPAPPHLSEREVEILQWLARGKSNAVIAAILGVSPHTVDTIMRRAFVKLEASNRIAAVLKALRAGLITL